MKLLSFALLPLALIGQTTEVKELRFRFDPDARLRPGETVAVQVQVWGDSVDKDGNRTSGRFREAANVKVAPGSGWVSKPYRFQGTDSGGYLNTSTGFAQIFQTVSSQFVLKDAVLYTAPMQPGVYRIEAESKGVKGSAEVTVDASAVSRRAPEKSTFPPIADTNKYRRLAEHWAPFVAQETWWQPKADIPTRFDYDGDWNGENNWENLDAGTSQAYVHYAAVETATHWFLHYNFFHPRDYSDNCIAGTCHENDNEGIILTVRKNGDEFGTLELMETLAHNNIYSYSNEPRLKKGAHDIDAPVDLYEKHHPMVFLEAGGHGALAAGARNSTFSVSRMEFTSGTGVTLVYKGVAERPLHPGDRNIGYDLIPIEETWWSRAKQAAPDDRIFDAPFDYVPFGNRPGGGRYAGSFWGRKYGANKAKPFWGWHDERTRRSRVLNTGQWALDPAYAVTRNVTWPANLPVSLDYLYNPYLGVGSPAAEPAPAAAPTEVTEGTCELKAIVDGSVVVALKGSEAVYQVLSGQPERETRVSCSAGLPDGPMREFTVKKSKGRGSVQVVEQPGEANGFAGRIRIDDSSRGADEYVLQVKWRR